MDKIKEAIEWLITIHNKCFLDEKGKDRKALTLAIETLTKLDDGRLVEEKDCISKGDAEKLRREVERLKRSFKTYDYFEKAGVNLRADIEELVRLAGVKADRRLFEAPCKLGDRIFVKHENKILEGTLIQIMHRHNQQYPKLIISVGSDALSAGFRIDKFANQIGKTVFLTPETAAEALEGEKP